MQTCLPHHVPSRVIAKMAIQDQIGHGQQARHTLELRLHHGLDAQQFRRQLDAGDLVLAPFGAPPLTGFSRLGSPFGGGSGPAGRLFGLAAHYLLDLDRVTRGVVGC